MLLISEASKQIALLKIIPPCVDCMDETNGRKRVCQAELVEEGCCNGGELDANSLRSGAENLLASPSARPTTPRGDVSRCVKMMDFTSHGSTAN